MKLILWVAILAICFSIAFETKAGEAKSAVTAEVGMDSTDIYNTAKEGTTPSFSSLLLRAILSLLFVALLIYVLVAFLKRYIYVRNKKLGSHLVEVLSSTFLGSKKSIYLVKVIDKILVLGVTEGNISVLTEIDDVDKLSSLTHDSKRDNQPSFPKTLSKAFKRLDNS